MRLPVPLLAIISIFATVAGRKSKRGSNENQGSDAIFLPSVMNVIKENDTVPASVINWDMIETHGRFSLLSMSVEHNNDGAWYIPSLHDKYSAGWNRSTQAGFLSRPHACGLRFYGVGLESTLQGFVEGGTGYVSVHFKDENGKYYWHGFDKNETNKLHCYFLTNKHYGSEFIDTPKTLGIAVYCPVSMDNEIGPYAFKNMMVSGYFCRVLAEYIANVKVRS